MDGVTLGHPRCNVEYCTTPLGSTRHRFCPDHMDREHLCAVRGCTRPPCDNMRTCNTPEHREIEISRRQRGQAYFRLKARLEHRRTAQSSRDRAVLPSQEIPHDLETQGDIDYIDFTEDGAETADEEADNVLTSQPPIAAGVEVRASPTKVIPPVPKPSKLKSSLTRRWTHNEQLMVRPCGMIVSRATFFEAESLSNSLVSTFAAALVWKSLTHYVCL